MNIKCEAIAENGLLRPLVPLSLKDAERVDLTIERRTPVSANTASPTEELLRIGLVRLDPLEAAAFAGCSVRELETTAGDQLPLHLSGGPLSETVISERGEG